MTKRLPKLDLNVTNRCNFRCTHCAFDSGIIKMPELNLGELEKILRETKELGGEKIDITGGEPLMRGDVEDIIALGKKFDYKIELVSNGFLLEKDKLERFKALGLDGIAISLDGSTYEIYRKIRGGGEETFKQVLGNIRETKKQGFYTKINTTVLEHNLEDIPSIIELALEIGVDEHGIYYFTPVGRGARSEELAVEPMKWLDFVRTRLKKYAGNGLKISLELPVIEKEHWKTGLGCMVNNERSHLQILPDGNVYPCAILAYHRKPIGNLHEYSIKDLWDNQELWEKYEKNLNEFFKKFKGYCINFGESFDIGDYNCGGYCLICPLRKFEIENVI